MLGGKGGKCSNNAQLSLRLELSFEGSYNPLFLKFLNHTSPSRLLLLCQSNTQLSPFFFCLISVKVFNYLILYADVRQGWNYKPARVGFSSKKAGTTHASSSKNLSLKVLLVMLF